MAKKIRQFYYQKDPIEGEEKSPDNKNNPQEGTAANYADGSIFQDYNVFPITQLGIQALPGTEFYLNGNVHPIVIGASGIYDLDIKNGARVTKLQFAKESMDRINSSNSGGYLIVDILYGEED